jgi:hypothetical protein
VRLRLRDLLVADPVAPPQPAAFAPASNHRNHEQASGGAGAGAP